MGFFTRGKEVKRLRDKVADLESRNAVVTQGASNFWEVLGLQQMVGNAAGETVTIDSALGVPAICAAFNFIPGTIAGLPLKVMARGEAGRKRANSPLEAILNGVANKDDMMSSFDLLKWWVEQALTGGRGVIFIERNGANRVINLWPLDPELLTIRRTNGRKVYEYREAGMPLRRYEAGDVLDLAFQLRADGLGHRSPIFTNRETVALAQAVTKYGAKFFANGGVPPFVVSGGFQSGAAMARAGDDLDAAVKKSTSEARQALILPTGLEINPLGSDAEKAQMIETQRFIVEQIARIYSLPPTFLQDLSNGTFSNTEQQDLHFVKHTIKRWVEQIEGELNLKLFGRGAKTYAEFSLDGLLRGDFKTRMEGYSMAVNSGVLMPNEARRLENRAAAEGGDQLYIQGAMVPIDQAGQQNQGGNGNAE